jgi:predicted RNA-binding protein with PUA-like domain
MKSEPQNYSIDNLYEDHTQPWDGVRNYQARNFMRDKMQIGDLAFFYHSNTKIPAIVGISKVISEPYPDFTQFDAHSKYFDPKSTKDAPRWMLIDVEFVEKFKRPVTLNELRSNVFLAGMQILQKGNRLSITPVSHEHWEIIMQLASK